MSEPPRIWWDGTDFLVLKPGPLLGQDGHTTLPGLYRAQTVEDITASEAPVVELKAPDLVPVDWSARFREAAGVAEKAGDDLLASELRAMGWALSATPSHVVEAIGRALIGEVHER